LIQFRRIGCSYIAACLLLSCFGAASADAGAVTGAVVVGVRPGSTKDSAKDSVRKKQSNANVVIWLTPVGSASRTGTDRRTWSGGPYRLVQQHKKFIPHVLVVPVGASVEFPNRDPFFHNVFSLFDGKRFDLGLYEAGTTHSVQFDRAGVCYIFCNIHPEMSAVVVVVNTQFYAISNASGEVAIPDVPMGRYLLSVWHERSQPEEPNMYPREITVSDGNTSLGTIRLVQSADVLGQHKNKYGLDYERPNPPGALYDQP
jgi:plastocyanin